MEGRSDFISQPTLLQRGDKMAERALFTLLNEMNDKLDEIQEQLRRMQSQLDDIESNLP